MTNRGMPHLVKIGKTSGNVEQRAKQLSSATSAPYEFKVFAIWSVIDADSAERLIHKKLAPYRTNRKREFFKLKPARAKELINRELSVAQLLLRPSLHKNANRPHETVPVLGHDATDQMGWWKSGG